MNKKIILIVVAAVIVLAFGILLFTRMLPNEYVPADDEIALNIQLNTKEDIGLLVFDYSVDGNEQSGGVSNADRSLLKHDEAVIQVWNRQELNSQSDTVELALQIRIITEYVNPNFENIYPDDITEYTDLMSWKAHFGETYFITITGDKAAGYEAVLTN